MLVFFASAPCIEEGFPPLFDVLDNRLMSYYYMKDKQNEFYFNKYHEKYNKIILDSGAFSSWSIGAKIDIDEYIKYINTYKDKINIIVNLDVIPGVKGQRIGTKEIERAAAQGFENYEYLISKGIPKEKIVHVFHQKESFKWLKKFLDYGMEYIGLSTRKDLSIRERMMWLDKCMHYVTNSKGEPIVKCHGFGVSGFDIMLRYPWYSVDSTTWALVGGYGLIMLPRRNGNKWDYSRAPIQFSVSQVKAKKEHFDNVSKGLQRLILDYIGYLNMKIGSSEFRVVDEDYKPEPNERSCSKKYVKNLRLDNPPSGKKWLEVIKEDGLMNNCKYRSYINALYLKNFGQNKPKPEIFRSNHVNGGFGLIK